MKRMLVYLAAIAGLLAAAGALFFFFNPMPGSEKVLTIDSVKRLVPVAAAMRVEDWSKLASSAAPPAPASLENQSLTLIHLTLSPAAPGPMGDPAAQETFRFLAGIPKPAKLAAELQRTISLGPLRSRSDLVTSIHSDRITEATCEADGESARGAVSFLIPGLYAGKVQYAAERRENFWEIVEFTLPGHGMTTRRGADGRWRIVETPARVQK